MFLSNSYDVESFLIIVYSEHLEGDKLPLVVRLFMREKSFNSCFILSMHDASFIRLLNLSQFGSSRTKSLFDFDVLRILF